MKKCNKIFRKNTYLTMPEVLATCSGSSATEQFNPILFFWRNLSEPSETSLDETLAFYSFWKFVVEFGAVFFENGKSELVPLKEQILIFRADSFHYTRHFPYQTRGHETSRPAVRRYRRSVWVRGSLPTFLKNYAWIQVCDSLFGWNVKTIIR